MKLVTGGAGGHGGHPVLRWMMDTSTSAPTRRGNIKPDKENHRKNRWCRCHCDGPGQAIRCGNDTSKV